MIRVTPFALMVIPMANSRNQEQNISAKHSLIKIQSTKRNIEVWRRGVWRYMQVWMCQRIDSRARARTFLLYPGLVTLVGRCHWPVETPGTPEERAFVPEGHRRSWGSSINMRGVAVLWFFWQQVWNALLEEDKVCNEILHLRTPGYTI